MDRRGWWATVHRVAKSQTLLMRLNMHGGTQKTIWKKWDLTELGQSGQTDDYSMWKKEYYAYCGRAWRRVRTRSSVWNSMCTWSTVDTAHSFIHFFSFIHLIHIPGMLMGFPGGSVVKNLPTMREIWVWSLDWEDPLEKEMATLSSILAWKIPWTEEPHWL